MPANRKQNKYNNLFILHRRFNTPEAGMVEPRILTGAHPPGNTVSATVAVIA